MTLNEFFTKVNTSKANYDTELSPLLEYARFPIVLGRMLGEKYADKNTERKNFLTQKGKDSLKNYAQVMAEVEKENSKSKAKSSTKTRGLGSAKEGPAADVRGVQDLGVQNMKTLPIAGKRRDWDPAPVAGNYPGDFMGLVNDYVYGNTQQSSWLGSPYTHKIWNEINQQFPKASEDDKLSYLRSMMDIAFAESHLGADYGAFDPSQNPSNYNRHEANAWNYDFNSDRPYEKNYDPTNKAEMADVITSSLENEFGVLTNRGLTPENNYRYHVGYGYGQGKEGKPITKEDWALQQQKVNNYYGLMGGAGTLLGDQYRWK